MVEFTGLKDNDVVLYLLWRLAEDVGVFYKPNNPQRRREMMQQLVANNSFIMNYIGSCLRSGDIALYLVALRTLTGFLEWCAIDSTLPTFLVDVLAMDDSNGFLFDAKLVASECILICLQRRGMKDSDVKALSSLFAENNFARLTQVLE